MKVEFETARGETVTAKAQPGDNLLRVAQAAGLPGSRGWTRPARKKRTCSTWPRALRGPAGCRARSIWRPTSMA